MLFGYWIYFSLFNSLSSIPITQSQQESVPPLPPKCSYSRIRTVLDCTYEEPKNVTLSTPISSNNSVTSASFVSHATTCSTLKNERLFSRLSLSPHKG